MDSDTNNLVLCIKKMVHSTIGTGYQSACDYPMVLGAGILLLLLHIVCPPLFASLVSSSPLFLLTGLLLGALLSYGEPCAPVISEETSQNQQVLSLKSKISIADCPVKEAEDVTVEASVEMRSDGGGVNIKERAPEDHVHDNHWVDIDVTFMEAEMVQSVESLKYVQSDVTVEREEHADKISDKGELQEFVSSNIETGNSNLYQLGESMSPCWQSADRQDPCSDSESDLSDESSSPDASMTDIIPMLEELHPLIDLGTGHPSLASRDNLISSSDDDEDDLEDDDIVSDDEDEADDENSQEDVMGNNSNMDSVMELQRAKNILKFELDQRLMDLQAADATHKLKDASRFHVQVPSISTSRGKPFDTSHGSEEEVIELPRIPDSAPSLLLPRQNLFDLPSGQIVDHGSHSDSDAHQGNGGELSGSLETHVGEEVKILSAVISDVGVFKVNNGNADLDDDIASFPIMKNISTTPETKDSVHTGSEQLILYYLSDSEHHVAEADSIGEANSLFKCRMDEVMVQSVSESGIGQPLTVKLEDESLPSESRIHAIGSSSVKDLNLQFSQPSEEALTCDASGLICEKIQEKPSEALPAADEHASELPAEDESIDQQTI